MALADRVNDDMPVQVDPADETASAKGLTILVKYGVDAWREWCQEEASTHGE